MSYSPWGHKESGTTAAATADAKSLSRVQLCMTPWTAAYQVPPSMGFSRQEYWSGVPLLSPALVTEHIYLSTLAYT